jgi:diguanylate cyclase (GGDEF)-like protein
MTIRKRFLLYSLLALGAFLAAVYIASRFALLTGFARLETDYARENLDRLKNELAIEQSSLSVMARDYAQWDRTYEFMARRNPDYVRTELTDETFNIIGIHAFVLFNRSGQPVIDKEVAGATFSEKDLTAIVAYKPSANASRQGVLELKGRIFLVAYEPVLTSRGAGESRGTLLMARELDGRVVTSLSRSAGLELRLEAPWRLPSDRRAIWTDGTNSVWEEGDRSMLADVPIKDLSGETKCLLVARIPSKLPSEGKKVMRFLLIALMLAGLIHCAVLLYVLEEKLLARVAVLNRKIQQVTVSGDLSLRLDSGGKDELSALANTVNAMLEMIQKAKSELLEAQEALRFHAEHDSLTGILNRRAIRDVLRRELARCRRENQNLGVIVADVDHFKRINDRYGHGAGDAALVGVVQRICRSLRPYDVVGRYGGEEFLIIAPGCDLELTEKLAERIRSAVSDEPTDLGAENVTITLSLGATLGTAESDPEFLVAVADAAMYQAKRNGRNRSESRLELGEPEAEASIRKR